MKRHALLLKSAFTVAVFVSFFGGICTLTSTSQEVLAVTKFEDIQFFQGIGTGGAKADPRQIARNIINIVMGFTGMLAVLVILYAGFQWMTAGGNKEQVQSAQKLLTNGVIGLIIIFSAWTIAQFVIYGLKESVKDVVG